jgi:hypothetical protein
MIAFEGGRLGDLPPRRRAIGAALTLLETDLMPTAGKETLFLASYEYARNSDQLDFMSCYFERAEKYMKSLGFLDTENLTARMIDASQRLDETPFCEVIHKGRNTL